MESYPQSVSINMQPYGRNGAGSPATTFGSTGAGSPATAFGSTGAGSPATAFGSTVTSFVRPESVPKSPDFVVWSFFNAIYCNPLCLGFIALIFSVKARDSKLAKDTAAARSYAQVAIYLNVAALCLGTVCTIITIVLLVLYLRQVPGV